MSRRKSDEMKLLEGRGTGRGPNYKPWIKVHEFGSKGSAHRLMGWKTNRIHQFLSDLELYFFLETQFNDHVIDIREQYPLLPLESTVLIAENLGIRHPAINNKRGNEIIMTTDFLITIKKGNLIKDIVRTIKYENDLSKRNIDKLRIEKEYFSTKGINDWGIVTESDVNVIKARNLYAIYNSYFWDKYCNLSKLDICKITDDFLNMLIINDYEVIETTDEFTDYMGWCEGEGLVFFKYLIAHKKLETNLDIPLNLNNIKVRIKE